MGLSYAPQYTWTDHFEERAFERFGVDKERLPEWVSRQRGSLTKYTNDEEQDEITKKYVSSEGVVFVCNTLELKFITCYEADDLLEEGKKITIHENNLDLFSQEVVKLARKYRLKDAKEILAGAEEHLVKFNELSQKLMTARLTDNHYPLIEQLVDEFHAVKAAMRIIEKRGDFKGYYE